MIAISILVRKKNYFPESSAVFSVYGNICYWIPLYLFTFPYTYRNMFRYYWFEEVNSTVYALVVASVAILSWSVVILPPQNIKDDLNKFYRIDHFAIPVTILVIILNFGWLSEFDGWAGAAVFNMIFLFQSITLIYYGCKNLNSKLTAAGTAMLAFLAFARYADLFDSLLLRAIVFLGVGAGIFTVGMLYSRRKKESAEVGQ